MAPRIEGAPDLSGLPDLVANHFAFMEAHRGTLVASSGGIALRDYGRDDQTFRLEVGSTAGRLYRASGFTEAFRASVHTPGASGEGAA
ncbi:hypothetical protein ACIBCU_17385 [Streptomyces sp. NPDC051064]|uniref:hypothetical protein n=1 Tax=Streptomyces sp. NPDC051064 TaxID=3365641 RepID=UPI0037B0E560